MNESRGRVGGGGHLCWSLETQDKAEIYDQGYISMDPHAGQLLLKGTTFLSGCPKPCPSTPTSCHSKFLLEELITSELFTVSVQLLLNGIFSLSFILKIQNMIVLQLFLKKKLKRCIFYNCISNPERNNIFDVKYQCDNYYLGVCSYVLCGSYS